MLRTTARAMMIGYALGDALGAPVEFMSRREILASFGPDGVVGLEPWSIAGTEFARGSYTDDTQMMLATARGLLDAAAAWKRSGILDVAESTHAHYLDWLETQSDPQHRRGPGATCLEALASGVGGSIDDPINDRKGAGGIMRVTPVGIAFEPERAFEAGAEIAAVTHGHATGYLSAGVFADVLSRVARGTLLVPAIAEAREHLLGYDEIDETLDALDAAVELHIAGVQPVEAIQQIGEGWVAEEALGIALFCALSYEYDWPAAVLAAVNITGDSDTTGGLTGALVGASLGQAAIPGPWISTLESAKAIAGLAEGVFDEYVGGAGVEL